MTDALAEADDFPALEVWADRRDEDWRWALDRLATLSPPAYARVLEHRLADTTGDRRRQVLGALVELDLARAREVAATLPPDAQSDLVVEIAALATRTAAGIPLSVPDLMALAGDPNGDWRERSRAILLLVPEGRPLAHPEPEVDEVLLAVVKETADECTFARGAAARALARRGRLDAWSDIVAALAPRPRDLCSNRDDLLGALAHLAQQDPTRRAAWPRC